MAWLGPLVTRVSQSGATPSVRGDPFERSFPVSTGISHVTRMTSSVMK